MKQIENIIRKTSATLVVKDENMVKGIYGSRQVVVKYDKSQDLYNLFAFTLKGTNLTKQVKVDGVFIDQLQNTINQLKK